MKMASILDLSSLSLDSIFTLGQTIEWLKGYRLGKYGFIGKAWNGLSADNVTDILSDRGTGAGSNAVVQISRGSTPIPLYVFYDSAAIANISNDELQSLHQFSSRFYEPEYNKNGSKYVTEQGWEKKPFVSVKATRAAYGDDDAFDTPTFDGIFWRGIRNNVDLNPYDHVTRKDGGPTMPLANFAPASREDLIKTPGRSFLSVPEVYSIEYRDILDPVKFIWRGRGTQPPISPPGEYTYSDTIKTTETTSSTREIKNTTDWNIGAKVEIGFNLNDIIKSGLPALGEGGERNKKSDFSATIEGNYRKVLDDNSTAISSLVKEGTHSETKTYKPDPLDKKVAWDSIKTMTFDEYYHKFKDAIIARPQDLAPETIDGERILVSGAEVTMRYRLPIIASRASVVQSSNYRGQVLGQVWQGFRATAGADYLFSSNPSAEAIHRDAAGDSGEISKFGNWLTDGGKNKVGSIYNNLENLGFLSRLWGDQRYLNVNEGGSKGQSSLQIIKYIDDSTVEEVRSIALDSKMANNVVEYEFEQTYNGKDLREAVLERNTQESVAKSSQALRADNSLISSNSTVSSNGRIEPFKESGDDPANDRSAMLPTEGASSDVETGYSKGTRSEDIFTISPNSKIVSSIDLRKDLSSDTIILGGNGTDTTGHLNIINYDPSRDTLTGELVDSLTWSYDPVYHVVRGVGESAENSSIQQTRERALNGEALLVNIYVPFGRFRNRDGKAVESRSKGYDIQAILDNLNGSDSGPTSSLYSTLTADHLLAANI